MMEINNLSRHIFAKRGNLIFRLKDMTHCVAQIEVNIASKSSEVNGTLWVDDIPIMTDDWRMFELEKHKCEISLQSDQISKTLGSISLSYQSHFIFKILIDLPGKTIKTQVEFHGLFFNPLFLEKPLSEAINFQNYVKLNLYHDVVYSSMGNFVLKPRKAKDFLS